ncbi:MAG: hypothetical protein COW32_08965, partial [Candidatus Aquicultor secundus]
GSLSIRIRLFCKILPARLVGAVLRITRSSSLRTEGLAMKKPIDVSEAKANCYEGYKTGTEPVRRMFNQAFIKKVYIKGKKASNYEFAEPYCCPKWTLFKL